MLSTEFTQHRLPTTVLYTVVYRECVSASLTLFSDGVDCYSVCRLCGLTIAVIVIISIGT